MTNRLELDFLIDAVSGSATESMIIPRLGAITDFICDANYIIEQLLLTTSEVWTAGTADLKVRKNGTDGDSECQLSTTKRWTDESHPDPNDAGNHFAPGDRLGLSLVTASWTPTTADMHARLIASRLS